MGLPVMSRRKKQEEKSGIRLPMHVPTLVHHVFELWVTIPKGRPILPCPPRSRCIRSQPPHLLDATLPPPPTPTGILTITSGWNAHGDSAAAVHFGGTDADGGRKKWRQWPMEDGRTSERASDTGYSTLTTLSLCLRKTPLQRNVALDSFASTVPR